MRRGHVVAGVVLLITGALLILVFLLPTSPTTVGLTSSEQVQLVDTRYTATTLSVSWTGQPIGTTVYLESGSPVCPPPNSVLVNSGRGASGAFSARLDPGYTYYLYACSGTTEIAVTLTFAQSGGVHPGQLLGGLFAVVGAVLLVLGLRRERRVRSNAGALRTSRHTPSAVSPGAPSAEAAAPRPPARAPGDLGGTPEVSTSRKCAACGGSLPRDATERCPACGALP